MLEKIMSFLDSADTERRIAATICAVVLPYVNSKLATPLPESAVIAAMMAAMGYVFQSAHTAAKRAAAPKVTTFDAAAKELGAK